MRTNRLIAGVGLLLGLLTMASGARAALTITSANVDGTGKILTVTIAGAQANLAPNVSAAGYGFTLQKGGVYYPFASASATGYTTVTINLTGIVYSAASSSSYPLMLSYVPGTLTDGNPGDTLAATSIALVVTNNSQIVMPNGLYNVPAGSLNVWYNAVANSATSRAELVHWGDSTSQVSGGDSPTFSATANRYGYPTPTADYGFLGQVRSLMLADGRGFADGGRGWGSTLDNIAGGVGATTAVGAANSGPLEGFSALFSMTGMTPDGIDGMDFPAGNTIGGSGSASAGATVTLQGFGNNFRGFWTALYACGPFTVTVDGNGSGFTIVGDANTTVTQTGGVTTVTPPNTQYFGGSYYISGLSGSVASPVLHKIVLTRLASASQTWFSVTGDFLYNAGIVIHNQGIGGAKWADFMGDSTSGPWSVSPVPAFQMPRLTLGIASSGFAPAAGQGTTARKTSLLVSNLGHNAVASATLTATGGSTTTVIGNIPASPFGNFLTVGAKLTSLTGANAAGVVTYVTSRSGSGPYTYTVSPAIIAPVSGDTWNAQDTIYNMSGMTQMFKGTVASGANSIPVIVIIPHFAYGYDPPRAPDAIAQYKENCAAYNVSWFDFNLALSQAGYAGGGTHLPQAQYNAEASALMPILFPVGYTLSGPIATGGLGTPQTFTVATQTGGNLLTPLVITPSASVPGVFFPASVTLAAGTSATGTFTFTPSVISAFTISTVSNGLALNPASVSGSVTQGVTVKGGI